MKTLLTIILSLFVVVVSAQQTKPEFDGQAWQAPYELPTPKDWGIERFPIPISFAPQIKYEGVEDIRFAPGWAKVKSEEYWSYAFLWYLNGEIKTNPKIIASNLKTYYAGLISANAPNIPADKLIPIKASFKETEKDKNDLKTYIGTIKILDYMQQKPIILNGKVHLKYSSKENKTFMFYELSPQPLSHVVWLSLDKLWADFKEKKE